MGLETLPGSGGHGDLEVVAQIHFLPSAIDGTEVSLDLERL